MALDDHGRLVDVGRRLPRRRHGVALAVVTGVTRAEDLAALAQLCHGFSEATVVRVRPGRGAPVGAGLPGLEVIDVDDGHRVRGRWGTARR